MKNVVRDYIADGNFAGIEDIAELLARLDEPTAQALLEGLESPEWRVRMRCAQALARAEPSEAVAARLIEKLDDPESSVRREASLAVARFGEFGAPAKPKLAQILRDSLQSGDDFAASKIMPAIERLGTNPAAESVLVSYVSEELEKDDVSTYLGDALRTLSRVSSSEHRDLMKRGLVSVSPISADTIVAILESAEDHELARFVLSRLPDLKLKHGFVRRLSRFFAGTELRDVALVPMLLAWSTSRMPADHAAKYIEQHGGGSFAPLIPDGSHDEIVERVSESLSEAKFPNARHMAKVLADTAFEARRRLEIFDAKAEVEHLSAGHYLVNIPAEKPDGAWLFVGSDLGIQALPEEQEVDQERVLGAVREGFAAAELMGNGTIRWVDGHLEFRMSWGTELWRWKDGAVSQFHQWGTDWTLKQGDVSIEDFVEDCRDRIRLAAAEMASGGYLALRKAATTDDELEFMQAHYESVKRSASRIGHRSLTVATTQLDIIEQQRGAAAEPPKSLDLLLENFEPDAQIDRLRGECELLSQLIDSLPEDHPVRERMAEGISILIDVDVDPRQDVPDATLGRWYSLDKMLRSTSLREPVAEVLAAKTRHPWFLCLFASIVQTAKPLLALDYLERALASSSEPTLQLLSDLESAYLRAGRDEEAEEIASRRDALAANPRAVVPEAEASKSGIELTLARVTQITNESYRIMKQSGSLKDHLELAREGAMLQQRVIEYFRPHPMSGASFPAERATSQASANYLDACIDNELWDQGAAFFREATDDLNVLRARFRDFPGPAESFFTCGIYCCLEAGGEDFEYAAALAKLAALERFGQERPYSHLLYAKLAARTGDEDGLKVHVDRGLELATGDEDWLDEFNQLSNP